MRRLALLALLIAAFARPAWAQPPVWVVHGKDGAVTLFGSIHVLPQGVDWEPPALADALRQADELWFEIPLDDGGQARAVQEVQAQAFLPEGQDLSRLLSADGARRLAAFAGDNHLSLAKIDRMQPWFADLFVSSFAYAKDGANQDAGVEHALVQAAPQARRGAFETAEQQIAMLTQAPQSAQIASLESSLKEAGDDPQEYANLVAAWLRGDEREIYQHDVLTLKAEAPVLFQRLITDRNAAWARALAARLKSQGQVVVVVGAAHLIGPQGVPARLRAMGFQVDGPTD